MEFGEDKYIALALEKHSESVMGGILTVFENTGLYKDSYAIKSKSEG
ncbi:MAG: hypothetical protein Q9N32_00465 [Gammaproteobacteria bacterium]|nr:hypothetical protein [Gammaproteobacteria bacterium]